MSLFKRIEAFFQASANQIANSLEDPKLSLDFSLQKLEESRNEINRSLVEISAAKKRLENQYDQLRAGIHKYHQQAHAAVELGRDDLARKALERKQESELRMAGLEQNLMTLDAQLESLKEGQANLERKITLFRAKKEELKAVYDASVAQMRLKETVYGISNDLADIGHTIQRAEARIEDMRSRAEAIESLAAEGVLSDALEPGKDDIDRELSRMGRDQRIEVELARLKALPASDDSIKRLETRDESDRPALNG